MRGAWALLAALGGTASGAVALGIADRPLHYQRAITTADLEGRSLYELTLLRNTIFARAGNRFRKKWLHEHFTRQLWYDPTGLDESRLTELGRKNAEAIAAHEAAIPRAELERRRDALLDRHRWAWLPSVSAMAFSPDGTRLLTGHRDGRAALWDVPSGRLARFLREEPGKAQDADTLSSDEPKAAAFTRDGKAVIVGTLGGTLLRWSLEGGAAPMRTELFAPTDFLSTDAGVAVLSAEDQDPTIQPLPNGPRRSIPRPQSKGVRRVRALSPDGRLGLWMEYGVDEPRLAVFDTTTGQVVRTMAQPSDAQAAAFSPDGTLLALAGGDGRAARLWLFDVARGTLERGAESTGPTPLFGDRPPASFFLNVVFSPDGRKVLLLDERGVVMQWDLGEARWSWRSGEEADFTDYEYRILSVSPDGRWVAVSVGSKGERIDIGQRRLIDAGTGGPAAAWKGHEPMDWTGAQRIEVGLLSRALGVADPFPPEEETSPLDDPSLLDQPITVKQLADLSPRDLRLLRNLIYARRGRPFRSRVLQDYFGRMAWYTADLAYTDTRLTKLDRQNIRMVQSVEAQLGGPVGEDEHARWFFRA